MSETDFLEGIDTIVVPADKNIRFVNWVVDIIAYYILSLFAGVLMGLLAPDFIRKIVYDKTDYLLFSYGTALFVFLFYYIVIEGLTKGKSLGKLITKTRAVKEDGSAINWRDAFKRGLARAVPFEPFSAFGDRPWHDKWTDTVVIKQK
ncbi:MAG: RDD family protein [Ferruginibacter sp.]